MRHAARKLRHDLMRQASGRPTFDRLPQIVEGE